MHSYAAKLANGFEHSAKFLEDTLEKQFQNTNDVPCNITTDCLLGLTCSLAVISALSVEIALKALINKVNGIRAKGHNHSHLFLLLPEELRQHISLDYKKISEKYNLENHSKITTALQTILNLTKNSFEQWRYIYETESAYEFPVRGARNLNIVLLNTYNKLNHSD